MDKEIVFGGMTSTPDDYAAPDGDLHLSINAIRENDVTRPIQQPYISAVVEKGSPVFIHRSPDFTNAHVITVFDGDTDEEGDRPGVYWRNSNEDTATLIEGTSDISSVKSINSIGHWLILSANGSTHYILFQDNSYVYYGTHIPYPIVNFTSTQNAASRYTLHDPINYYTINHSRSSFRVTGLTKWPSNTDKIIPIPEEKADTFHEQARSTLLELVKDIKDMGLFLFPRLLRVGLRLYNGDIVNVTDPVLVYGTGTRHALICPLKYTHASVTPTTYEGDFMAGLNPFTLDFVIDNIDELEKWNGVVCGLVFYSSSDFYDFDQDGRFDHLIHADYGGENTFCCVSIPEPRIPLRQQIENNSEYYKLYDYDLEDNKNKSSYISLYIKGNHELDLNISFDLAGKSVTLAVHLESDYDAIRSAETISAALAKYGIKVVETGRSYLEKIIVDPEDEKKLRNTFGGNFINSVTVAILGEVNDFSIEGSSGDWITYSVINGQPLPSSLLSLSALEASTPLDETTQNGSLRPISASFMLNYNMRQVYANISKKLYDPGKMPVFINMDSLNFVAFWWYLNINGQTIIVKTYAKEISGTIEGIKLAYSSTVNYLSYPDVRCTKVVALLRGYDTDNPTHTYKTYYSFPLVKSEFFGLSQFVLDPYLRSTAIYAKDPSSNNMSIAEKYTENRYDEYIVPLSASPEETKGFSEVMPSALITSDAMNPFLWDPANEQTVGSGRILGIATAAKPLSEGQSGQFPLYAFTDSEGIFSMSVDGDGSLRPGQPILQDIVLGNGESITSLDDSVMYACSRGIVELRGSSENVISDALHNDPRGIYYPDSIYKKGILINNNMASVISSKLTHLTVSDVNAAIISSTDPLLDFLSDAYFIYDSTSQRIYIFSSMLDDSALVYSRKSSTFGLVTLFDTNFIRTVNAYPDSVFVAEMLSEDNVTEMHLCSFGHSNLLRRPTRQTDVDVALLTRPLHLDSRDIHKTIRSLILRGNYNEGSLGMGIYASNDLKSWIPITSSGTSYIRNHSGTPFKYYRFLVCGTMLPDESIFSCQATYTTKLTDKPR